MTPAIRPLGVALSVALALGSTLPAAARPPAAHPAPPGAAEPVLRSAASYRPGALGLTRADGVRVRFDEELAFDGAVVLNFVFTTCTAVCPIASHTLAQLQDRLGPSARVRLMSVSTDPLNDTPAVLKAYGARFGAGKRWHFYTGTVEESIAAQRAFDVFRGDKMNHAPFTLVRPGPGAGWVRLDGFPSADQLLRELRPAPPSR